ncbi:MAG TPA: WD40 repeat domain-containing protein [Anaerolineales bacterium]|nr:WD40 repeat domain-containing protein [Anaerolineales bacterium]
MKQHKWLSLIICFMLTMLSLDACTFSFEVLPTAASSPSTFTPVSSATTETPIPPTAILPSETPTLISIRNGTISMLEIFKSFAMEDIVHTLAFNPDGRTLAAAGGNTGDFAIHIWDVPDEQAIGTLGGHSDIVWDMAFSPDGEMLVSVSKDKTAQIWDWRNGDILKILNFPGQANSVRFSPDGQILAVGGVDEMQNQIEHAAIWTYSVGSWEPLVKFSEYLNIGVLAFSPKGGTLIGGGTSRNVQVWRASDGASLFTLSHAHQVSKAAISPDGSTVATATCEVVVNADCAEGSAWLWDLPTGKLIGKLTGFPDFVEHIAFTADGSSLIAASRDGTLRFYDTSNDQLLFEFTSPGGISAMALSPDSGLLATGNVAGEIYLWKIVYRP